MLIFKRIVTAFFSFVIFFFILYFTICFLGGAVAGAIAGAQNPANAYLAGQQAGRLFVQNNIIYILIASSILSLILSSWLSFFGILPWCKKKA